MATQIEARADTSFLNHESDESCLGCRQVETYFTFIGGNLRPALKNRVWPDERVTIFSKIALANLYSIFYI